MIEYFSCDRPEYWLSQIGKSDWEAGKFLHELLSKKILSDIVGEHPKVLMLTDGDELISFCTYSEKDDIQPTPLTPWMGFVYTFPQYRGHRYVGRLFQEIEKIAKAENVHDIFISTNHTGLYEKYGCEFYQMMNDVNDEPSRVYRKHMDNDN
ncbi:MAG: GNAT family N-acetyltransferase [Lachnospiraceae bacterium]|nr:GNAT family N-acetyltransferase [Lachnospiraceae bacterium]